MPETTLNLSVQEAYGKLKAKLAEQKCRITAEEPPGKISAVQGSIWGTSAKTAQKNVTFSLREEAAGTKAATTSSLTQRYVTFTAVGIIFSAALIFVCGWIALNMQAYQATGAVGFWGWLAQTQGALDAYKAALFERLGWILTVFLGASLAAEAVILVRVKSKLNVFAQEIVESLK